jgi:hypothetical protein
MDGGGGDGAHEGENVDGEQDKDEERDAVEDAGARGRRRLLVAGARRRGRFLCFLLRREAKPRQIGVVAEKEKYKFRTYLSKLLIIIDTNVAVV